MDLITAIAAPKLVNVDGKPTKFAYLTIGDIGAAGATLHFRRIQQIEMSDLDKAAKADQIAKLQPPSVREMIYWLVFDAQGVNSCLRFSFAKANPDAKEEDVKRIDSIQYNEGLTDLVAELVGIELEKKVEGSQTTPKPTG